MLHGDGPERCYLIKKAGDQWEFPVEILNEYSGTFENSVPSFSKDNSKIYKTVTGKDANIIEVFDGIDFSLSKRMRLEEFSSIERAFSVGRNGLVVLAAKKKESFMAYYYVQQVSNEQWSAPIKVPSIPNEDGNYAFDPVITGFPGWVMYSDFSTGQIRLSKLPSLITSHLSTREVVKQMEKNTSPEKAAEEKIVKRVGAEANYHALLIGNEDYLDDQLNLEHPIDDAEHLKKVLVDQYAFDLENIKILKNANRNQIFEPLFQLRQELDKNDNLLIFYAGHGSWDDQVQQGYWWPVDAAQNNPANWLSNSDLREQIRGINSAHTLLISDACFSGGIFKTRGVEDMKKAGIDLQLLYKMPSRRAISSGTLSTVPDKSVFFKYLIKYLTENDQIYLSSSELFTKVRRSVLNNSLTVPQDGVIMDSGDEGGDFIFIKKNQ